MAEAPLTIKVESEALRAYLRNVPLAVTRGMAAAAERAGIRFLGFHRQERLRSEKVRSSGPLAGTGGARKPGQGPGSGFIGRRTLFVHGDRVENVTLTMELRSAAAIRFEKGGTVDARAGGYLTIPMPVAKDARGKLDPRYRRLLRESRFAREAGSEGFDVFAKKTKKGRQRQLRALITVKSRRTGNLFLARLRPNAQGRARLEYVFHLQKQVQVRPRLEFVKTWKKYEPKAVAIYRQALPYAIRAAGKKLGQVIPLPEGLPE